MKGLLECCLFFLLAIGRAAPVVGASCYLLLSHTAILFKKGRFEYFWNEGLLRLFSGDTLADCGERSPHSRREAGGRRCRDSR